MGIRVCSSVCFAWTHHILGRVLGVLFSYWGESFLQPAELRSRD
jgi:hypothetical protein